MAEITHRVDDKGVYRQIVKPRRLREILDADGADYERPDDEWKVEGEEG